MVCRLIVLLALSGWHGAASAQQDATRLKRDFQNPPADTRPGCYWYWINDNISKEGITKDLEAMARVGIGRAYIGHIFDRKTDSDTPVGEVPFMSAAWWDALQWAVKEAGRCGVDIGFFNSPGWSQSGAPWIKPSESMRYLGHSEVEVAGGKLVDTILPVPLIDTFPNAGGHQATRHGPNFTEADFQDVRVVAFKHPDVETGRIAGTLATFSGNTTQPQYLLDGNQSTVVDFPANVETSITIQLPVADSASSTPQVAVIKPLDHSYTFVCTVEESDDGKAFRPLTTYQEERGHQGPGKNDNIIVPLGRVTAKHLRLGLNFKHAALPRIRVAEIALSSEAMLAGYVRKQLGESSPHTLVPSNAYIWDTQIAPTTGTALKSDQVVDLGDKMTSGGKLRWDAPAGNWTILRMGMIPIGTMCGPASPESRGLEIDKMNRQHASTIFEGMVGEFLRRTPEADRKALKYIIADSYETGPQNWTDGFVEKFITRFGYSPVRFLPVMTGRVVDSPNVSDRFLWDLRRLIVESVATDYVGGLRDVANRNGLKLWLENYGHWGFISEFLLYGSQTDEVGGEFWESSDPIGNIECRAAASSAHIYGKNSVFAEGFTSARNFKASPATMKLWCDWAFGTGINHMILHVYIHQPREKRPGIIEWFGTEFNRHNTWFEQSKAFNDYMRRCAVLLKAGQPVADVAYYIGENSPSMQGPMDPALLPGHDYDSINSDVLINSARVENGRIVLPHGVSYAVLVLPKQTQMRPEVAAAIRKLVSDGALVIGPKPEHSPSLQNYPASDARLKSVADELWGGTDVTTKGRQHGKGWIYASATLSEVFAKHNIAPDVDLISSPTLRFMVAGTGKLGVNQTGGILFKHRQEKTRDIYFLSNTSDFAADITASFRQSNRIPWLWDAVSGEVRQAQAFTQSEGRTSMPLQLAASESVFVVFEKNPESAQVSSGSVASNTPDYEVLPLLKGKWNVSFAGPDGPMQLVLDQLSDWSSNSDNRIKYFSGTATYEQSFTVAKRPVGKMVLDLGEVGVIATVLVNDKVVGTVWSNPWAIDISDYIRDGENNLKIQVTNTWNNRMVGDAEKKFEPGKIDVSRAYIYNKQKPLLSSGLLGPVTIKAERPK